MIDRVLLLEKEREFGDSFEGESGGEFVLILDALGQVINDLLFGGQPREFVPMFHQQL